MTDITHLNQEQLMAGFLEAWQVPFVDHAYQGLYNYEIATGLHVPSTDMTIVDVKGLEEAAEVPGPVTDAVTTLEMFSGFIVDESQTDIELTDVNQDAAHDMTKKNLIHLALGLDKSPTTRQEISDTMDRNRPVILARTEGESVIQQVLGSVAGVHVLRAMSDKYRTPGERYRYKYLATRSLG